jgi:hypothetical protein
MLNGNKDNILTEIDVSLEKIDQLKLSDRLLGWKKAMQNAKPRIRTELAELAVESWQDSEGDDIEIRRAKMVKNILENIPVHIHNWQLLAGSETEHIFGGHPDVDLSSDAVLKIMGKENFSLGSPVVSGEITEEGRKKIIECAKFFQG